MPNLQDKLSEPPFPSELNPLTNPVLERNLGRWAQVYFSTPPAKRQQAVSKLLEEIQRETGAEPGGENHSPLFCPRRKIPERPLFRLPAPESAGPQVLQPVRPGPPSRATRSGRKSGRYRSWRDGTSGVRELRERCAVAARPGLQRSGRIVRSAEASMEISARRGRACVGWLSRICSGPRDRGQEWLVIQYRAAGECSGGFASARFFAGSIQSTRSDFGASPKRPRPRSRQPSRPMITQPCRVGCSRPLRNLRCSVPHHRGRRWQATRAALPICGSPSAISEAAWACGIPPRPRNCCGRQSGNKMPPQPFCCQASICAETAFPAAAIRRAFCSSLPPGAEPRRRRNSCAIWNRRAAGKESRKQGKTKRPSRWRGSSVLCVVSDSALQVIAAQAGLMETENILLPAFQNLRRAPGLAGGGLRTREPTRRGSRVRACRR